jgi:hypothetical protein
MNHTKRKFRSSKQRLTIVMLVVGFSLFVTPPTAAQVEIWQIQGSGSSSPFNGQVVSTRDNVVTAVGPNGFFVQTPTARTDGNPETSDGIFVFTGSAPGVKVGDLVDVSGTVQEFFNFTEFANNPTVTVKSSGHPLPAAVPFDATTPSPKPPRSETELERFEGMRVEIASGVVAGPNQFFSSDPIAEVLIVASANRPFREPGIVFPGLMNLPVWDGNPEIFELDPDRLGLPNAIIPAGSIFSATGVLGFEFGGYELWPTQLSFITPTLPRPVRARTSAEATIATLNLFRLFDDVNDPSLNEPVLSTTEYQGRLSKLSKYIREVMGAPDILAVQEAENVNTLQDLAARIQNDEANLSYAAHLMEGNDIGGIDVGFLARSTLKVNAVAQLGKSEIFTFDGSLLHDRPPLILQAELPDGRSITVLNVHLRSLSGIDHPTDGLRVRAKRNEQARSVSLMVQNLQTTNPNLVVIGDFNAFQFTDGYVDVLGQIMGTPADASQALIPGTDNVNPDLVNAILSLPAEERYSFVFNGTAQALDHVLISQALQAAVSGMEYARGNADVPKSFETDTTTSLRSSDHDGLVLYLRLSPSAVDDKNEISLRATGYELAQNYPNPFGGEAKSSATAGKKSTTISFALPDAGKVTLRIFTETGQLVRTLINDEMAPGRHAVHWDGRNQAGNTVAAGVYLYQLVVWGRNGETIFTETRRMTLMKRKT